MLTADQAREIQMEDRPLTDTEKQVIERVIDKTIRQEAAEGQLRAFISKSIFSLSLNIQFRPEVLAYVKEIALAHGFRVSYPPPGTDCLYIIWKKTFWERHFKKED